MRHMHTLEMEESGEQGRDLLEELDTCFYPVPVGGCVDVGSWLASIDPWYLRQVFIPFQE